MEGAWRSKRSPAWPPPSSVPPLPPAPTAPAPPPGSAIQTGMSSGHFFHPSAQEVSTVKNIIVQEPLVFNTLNLDSYNSGKAELSSSFLDVISGRRHASSEMQLSYPGSVSAKLQVRDGDLVSGASSGVPTTCIPPSSEYHGHDAVRNGEFSPFAVSRPLSISTCTNAPLCHNFRSAASSCHSPGFGNLVSHQASQANCGGIDISPRTLGWGSSSSSLNASRWQILNQTTQKMPSEAGPSIPSNSSATLTGRPLVFCMNKVGELFVSDMGLFGIICFCHELPMSVAKFCEHSGSPSANPGESIHLENGMSVAQWRKLFFGVMATDHINGWDWSDGSSTVGGLLGSKCSSFATLSQNSGLKNSFGASGGLGKSGEQRNKTIFPNHAHTRFGEQIASEKSARRDADNAHQRSDEHNLFFKSFSVSAQGIKPAFAKNRMVHAIKESPILKSFEGSHLNLNQRKQEVGHQVAANNFSCLRENGNLPISFSRSGMKNSFSYENHIHDYKGKFPREKVVVDHGGPSSNIELRLGHPSQKNETSISSSPAAMHTLHLGACTSQKPQLHPALIDRIDAAADCPREIKKPRLNLQCTPSEASSLNRQFQHSFGSNMLKHSESADPMDDATKRSLISFLSHLNTEGNNSSNSTDIIGNCSEYLVTKVLDNDALYSKCSLPDFTTEPTEGIERKSKSNKSNFSNNVDQGKGLRKVDNTFISNHMVYDKPNPDARVISSATGRQSTLYFNKLSGMTQTAPNCTTSNQYPEVSFLGTSDSCNHAIHKPTSPFHKATSTHGSLNSEIQNLRAESLKSISSMHMERSPSSLEPKNLHRRSCCLSDVEQRRNVGRDDLVATQKPKRPYCIIQQDASDVAAKSAHSFANCYSGGDVQMLAIKPDASGPYNCCDCLASRQKPKLCSKEHGTHLSSYQLCHADEQPCLRLGTFSNNSYPDSRKMEICNHKAASYSGKCCCTVPPNYLAGCCFPRVERLSDAPNKHCFTKAKIMHTDSTYDKVLQDEGRVGLDHRVVKNNCRFSLWRDVPDKVIGSAGATSNENIVQMSQATKVVADQLTGTAPKELDGAQQESEFMKKQHMSSISSGSSAPVVTEVSVDVNNMVSFPSDVGDSKIVHNILVDEESRTEKCGSSDGAHDNTEREEAIIFKDKMNQIKSSCNLTSELRLNISSIKRVRKSGCTGQGNNEQIQEFESAYKTGKNKGRMKWCSLDASVPVLDFSSMYNESPEHIDHPLHQSSADEIDLPHQPDIVTQKEGICSGKSSWVKRKRSALLSSKSLSSKRLENYHEVLEYDVVPSLNDDQALKDVVPSLNDDQALKKQKVYTGKMAKEGVSSNGETQYMKEKEVHVDAVKPPKFISLSCLGNSLNHVMDTSYNKVRPVVCGNSGIISSGLSDKQKPAKLVSLSSILKRTSRCSTTEYEGKPRPSSMSGNKKTGDNAKTRNCNIPLWKLQLENEDSLAVIRNGTDSSNSVYKNCSSKNDNSPFETSIMKQEADCGSDKSLKSGLHHEDVISRLKRRCKGTRKCSLSKLTGTNKHATKPNCFLGLEENECSDPTETRNQLKTSPSTDIGNEHHAVELCSENFLKCPSSPVADAMSEVNSQNNKDHGDETCEVNKRRPSNGSKCQSFHSDSNAFCCVCGSSNKEDVNQLLQCNQCFIRVHQACYGVTKAPKGRWCCRACKTTSSNIVCVLCGYGGGAMTRALKSRNIVKSLWKAWNVGSGSDLLKSIPSTEGKRNDFSKPGLVCEESEYGGGSVNVVGSVNSEVYPVVSMEKDLTKINAIQHSNSVLDGFQSYNSVIAGMVDPSVTQWVHMVCGLWTPGTRCPNVDTMSTFDVSGASLARKNNVCSMCNRPGGSCIGCRVLNCTVQFHPWCAHQKGLLQSEIEGDNNEKVGFYGRCILHATQSSSHNHTSPVNDGVENPKHKDFSCARTEGFKGRKRDEGFNLNHQKACNDGGGCIVSQEQINAWLHINGQKKSARGVVKAPCSDLGHHDTRKEYIRYKQSKGWKHLVVYKSGIHALGLYTSQFIAREAMVVEYVGEIVGLRVADKREIEYQSGRRLQYKSACYFFRIDKEHIIDATRKGGIARFVNHSCLPNCVARVISVRNEKKVVFFAERDIYPGEEITYDYHFSHEDEDEKIPCFCNSKNCRRYLN